MMQPGRELDSKVAEALGHMRCPNEEMDHFITEDNILYLCKYYSTNWEDALEAWNWLERTNTWKDCIVALGNHYGNPSVMVVEEVGITLLPYEEWLNQDLPKTYPKLKNFYISGKTYPHAICLTVLASVTKEI